MMNTKDPITVLGITVVLRVIIVAIIVAIIAIMTLLK